MSKQLTTATTRQTATRRKRIGSDFILGNQTRGFMNSNAQVGRHFLVEPHFSMSII
jgi:acetyltransferase-like isoleucine patch superfamily enzyme